MFSSVVVKSVCISCVCRLQAHNTELSWHSISVVVKVLLLVGQSRDWFPVVSLDFSVTYSFRPYHGPGVDSAPSENEYQEHFLGLKAVGAWGWQPHHLHVMNVMESGSLNLLQPSGPHRACYRTALPLPLCQQVQWQRMDEDYTAAHHHFHLQQSGHAGDYCLRDQTC